MLKVRKRGRWFFLKPETWNLKPKRTASALGERSYSSAAGGAREKRFTGVGDFGVQVA